MKNHLNILTRFTCAGLLSWVVATSSADGETPASPGLRLNEILASNRAGRLDDEGESSDWVEIHNSGTRPERLGSYHLTDDPALPQKWKFPNNMVPAGGYRLVWMSGLGRTSLSPEALRNSAASIPFATTLIEPGANWKYLYGVPDDKRSIRGWTALEFDDSAFAVGAAGFGYGDEDDATEVPPGTRAVLIRHEFTLDNPLASESLVLQLDYDDGFAAYLNGTRVVAVNAPGDEPGLNSLATTGHDAGSPERFDLSDKMGLLRAGKNVLAIAGLNISQGSSDLSLHPVLGTIPPVCHANFRLKKGGGALYLSAPDGRVVDQVEYPKQVADQSLGRAPTAERNWGYFLTPSPGAANTGPQQPQPVKSRISFAPKPGAVAQNIEVRIKSKSSLPVEIRFTKDGSNPDPSSPLYEGPIKLNKTSLFRAAAFLGVERTGAVKSATYLVGRRPSLPVVSISMKPQDFEDIHLQRTGRGRVSERPAFFEVFNPAGKREVATGFGLRLHGGAGRRGGMETKKSYRVYFRKAYGDGRLKHPIIPHADIKDFDKLVFRANFGDGRSHGAYIRDQVIRDLQIDMGGEASRGWYCVLLINGTDHGVYNICERMDEEFFISHLGPGKYDVINTGETLLNGTREGWDSLKELVRSTDFSDDANFAKLAQQVDIENFTRYVILNLWVQNFDWPHNNWYAARRVPDGKWIFLCWDAEWGFWGGPFREQDDPYAFIDSGAAYGFGPLRSLFLALLGNPNYCNYYQEEVRKHLDGALSRDHVLSQLRRHAEAIRSDIEHEFETRRYGKERWRETIANVERFVDKRGEAFQRYTDEYFARTYAADSEERVAVMESTDGSRHVIYRADDGHLRELSSSADGQQWQDAAVSEVANAPPAVGRPSVYSLAAGDQRVIYRGTLGHLHELARVNADSAAGDWRHTDITVEMKIPAAGCDPTAVVFQGVPHIVYVDHNQRGREIWFDGQWRQHPLPAAPLPASEVAISKTNERLYVTYRTRFGNPCELTLNSSPLESKRIWTPRLIKRLPSQGRPIAFNLADRRYVIFRATEKWPVRQPFLFHHILRDLKVDRPPNALLRSSDVGDSFWRLEPIGTPPSQVAGDPCVIHDAKQELYFLAYRDIAGHIQEAAATGEAWPVTDPTELAGAPVAAGEPAGLVSAASGSRYYVYRGTDGHLHELHFDGSWTHRDLTAAAVAAP